MFKNLNSLIFWCCLFMGVSVVCGAFGSHSLRSILSVSKLETFKTGCNYLAIQSLGIIFLILFNNTIKLALPPKAIYTLFVGMLIFCISLFVVSFSEIQGFNTLKYFGAVAPVGGSLMVIGWFWVTFSLRKILKTDHN